MPLERGARSGTAARRHTINTSARIQNRDGELLPELHLVGPHDCLVLPWWVEEHWASLAALGFPPDDATIQVDVHDDWVVLSRDDDRPLHLPNAPADHTTIATIHGKFYDTGGDYWEVEARVFQINPEAAIVAIVHCRDEVEITTTDPVDAKHILYNWLFFWMDQGLEVDAHFSSH